LSNTSKKKFVHFASSSEPWRMQILSRIIRSERREGDVYIREIMGRIDPQPEIAREAVYALDSHRRQTLK
jgi:hypothetical protein